MLTPERLQEIRETTDARATTGKLWAPMVRELIDHIDDQDKQLLECQDDLEKAEDALERIRKLRKHSADAYLIACDALGVDK